MTFEEIKAALHPRDRSSLDNIARREGDRLAAIRPKPRTSNRVTIAQETARESMTREVNAYLSGRSLAPYDAINYFIRAEAWAFAQLILKGNG